MTDDMMNLRAVLEMSPDADLLREMIGFAEGGLPFQLGTPPHLRSYLPIGDSGATSAPVPRR